MTTKTYIDLLGREILEGEFARDKETDRNQRSIHATITAMMGIQYSKKLHKERENGRDTIREYQDIYRTSKLTKTILGIAFCSLAFAIVGRYLLVVFGITRPSWMWAVGAIVGMMALVLQAGLNMFE